MYYFVVQLLTNTRDLLRCIQFSHFDLTNTSTTTLECVCWSSSQLLQHAYPPGARVDRVRSRTCGITIPRYVCVLYIYMYIQGVCTAIGTHVRHLPPGQEDSTECSSSIGDVVSSLGANYTTLATMLQQAGLYDELTSA